MPTFLKAEWRKLAIVNYIVDPGILKPFIPYKTELDLYNGNCFVSLVGFMFLNTRVMGFKIPYHINFEEVNLRFYVKHRDESGEVKRGVVFIKEIVPKKAITYVANKLFNEKYETMLMKHEWAQSKERLNIAYFWGRYRWNSIWIESSQHPFNIPAGSEEEFITEHYWGYANAGKSKTIEYEVAHPSWQLYPVRKCYVDVSFDRIYGEEFGFLRNQDIHSSYLAEGSLVKVMRGKVIK